MNVDFENVEVEILHASIGEGAVRYNLESEKANVDSKSKFVLPQILQSQNLEHGFLSSSSGFTRLMKQTVHMQVRHQ